MRHLAPEFVPEQVMDDSEEASVASCCAVQEVVDKISFRLSVSLLPGGGKTCKQARQADYQNRVAISDNIRYILGGFAVTACLPPTSRLVCKRFMRPPAVTRRWLSSYTQLATFGPAFFFLHFPLFPPFLVFHFLFLRFQ